jgi:hypothetical protein
MEENREDLDQYKQAFTFLRFLGLGGIELADFVRTYGIEVAAVQLRMKPTQLRRFLAAACDMASVGAALHEVQLRRSGKRVALDAVQRSNFNALLDNLRTSVGTLPLARRLGITRQAIYAQVADGGPTSVSPFVSGVAMLLGYGTMTAFLGALHEGVPPITTLRRADFKKPSKAKLKQGQAE